jgi:phosphatidylglycerophosphatase A
MPILKTAADRLAIAIATGGGAGFLPKAPGTAGSVVGVVVFLLLESAQAGAYFLHVILFFLIAGTLAAHRVETLWGHDSQRIVIDEVIGQWIAFSLSAGRMEVSVFSVLAGFALFRLFDIVKPPPLRRLEKLPGGVGVIADDVGAGFYALGVLTVIQHFSS